MLLRLIAGEALVSSQVELATTLIIRESCAPPSARSLQTGKEGQQSSVE
jgi:DNA-binding LacI/PurR family transcriptional regulator